MDSGRRSENRPDVVGRAVRRGSFGAPEHPQSLGSVRHDRPLCIRADFREATEYARGQLRQGRPRSLLGRAGPSRATFSTTLRSPSTSESYAAGRLTSTPTGIVRVRMLPTSSRRLRPGHVSWRPHARSVSNRLLEWLRSMNVLWHGPGCKLVMAPSCQETPRSEAFLESQVCAARY